MCAGGWGGGEAGSGEESASGDVNCGNGRGWHGGMTREGGRVVAASRVTTGKAHVFYQHTSCSSVIMENADPTARRDLERWLDRLVPEDHADFRHTAEGPDDRPSHLKMALTRTSKTVPVSEGRLALGTWQGFFGGSTGGWGMDGGWW